MNKTCIFYAGKYHLSMILLNILSKEYVKKYTVITFLENPIEHEINNLKNKYNIKINSKNNIDFSKTKTIENKKIEITDNMVIIIGGNNNYIKEVNNYLKKRLTNNNNINIVNCYDYDLNKELAKDVLKNDKKIITTTGEKVFD